jgi:hypothetical protein
MDMVARVIIVALSETVMFGDSRLDASSALANFRYA